MPDDTQIDLRQTLAELRWQLDARTAERDEALEQQTATAEVLKVINSSPGDLGLVFETLLGTGARLCKAEQAVITLRNSCVRQVQWAISLDRRPRRPGPQRFRTGGETGRRGQRQRAQRSG